MCSSAGGGDSGKGDGARGTEEKKDAWTTITSKYESTKNRGSYSESEDPLVKTLKITRDGKSNAVKDG